MPYQWLEVMSQRASFSEQDHLDIQNVGQIVPYFTGIIQINLKVKIETLLHQLIPISKYIFLKNISNMLATLRMKA
jgi:hypothetical protein